MSSQFTYLHTDGTVKTTGGDRRLKPSTLSKDRPERGEGQKVFRGESDEFSSPNASSRWLNPWWWESEKWFLACHGRFHLSPTQSQTVHAERRIISYSIEVHRRYQNNTYVTWCKRHIDDYWDVDGEKELSDAWTGFTRFIFLIERAHDRYTWSGWTQTRKETNSGPDNVKPDMWKHVSDAAKSKAKKKWAIEKPKFENARQMRGIFFIEPEDEEFEHTMKNACRKLEIPIPAAMPCKTPANGRRESFRSVGKHKTKHACIVDADESIRIRLDCVPHRYHEDHIAAKGINSLNHYNFST